MAAVTPLFKEHESLPDLASRYVDVAALPWKPTPCEGIEMKILMEDEESGMMTGSIIDFDQQVLGTGNSIAEPPPAVW